MSEHFACSYIVSFNVQCSLYGSKDKPYSQFVTVLEILFHCNLRFLSSGRSTFLVLLGCSPHKAVTMFLSVVIRS